MANSLVLRSYEFRREREKAWLELEELVSLVEKKSIKALSAEQLTRLPILYRAALSSLSVARSISLDRNLVEYLESLSGRAYFCVYGTRRQLRDVLADFFLWSFPSLVRKVRGPLIIASLLLIVGALAGFFITLENQDRFYTFVSADYAQGRGPSNTTDELREVLYSDEDSAGGLAGFASFLFTHNAKVGMTAFALGFVLGVPVFYLMFFNGLILGAFAAIHQTRGLAVDFWGWLLPHGVTELLAVVLCGAAGLVLAQALTFPGRYSRLANLGARGRDAGQVVVGAVVLFFIAGLIEGIFRQKVHSVPIRYAVATVSAIWWIFYFGWVGRERDRGPS